MWSRVVEAMLGCWLLISPFIFRHAAEETAWRVNDFASGTLVIALALLSYWRPLRYAHLAIIGVGAWLVGFAYYHYEWPMPPALQNNFALGVLLMMFAVIPNHATTPPEGWRGKSPTDRGIAAKT